MKKVYNKLVRDKVPQIIKTAGKNPVTRILNEKEYLRELVKKLKEEVDEFAANPSIEELADIKEVVIALRLRLNIHAGELEDMRRKKADERGRFKKRIFLKEVIE